MGDFPTAIMSSCVNRSLLQHYIKYRDVIGQVVDDDTSVLLDNLQHYCEPIVKAIDTRCVCVLCVYVLCVCVCACVLCVCACVCVCVRVRVCVVCVCVCVCVC